MGWEDLSSEEDTRLVVSVIMDWRLKGEKLNVQYSNVSNVVIIINDFILHFYFTFSVPLEEKHEKTVTVVKEVPEPYPVEKEVKVPVYKEEKVRNKSSLVMYTQKNLNFRFQ